MSYEQKFSAAERREVTLQCVLGAFEALAGGLGETAALQVLIDVVAGDMARLTLVSAQVASIRSITSLLLGSTGGAVTDAIGRKPSLLMGRLFGGSGGGGLCWRMYLLCWPNKTVATYMGFQVVLSVISCVSGAFLASNASIDDRFGSRPALRAAVSAHTGVWHGAAGLVSPVLGALIYRRHRRAGLLLSIVCVACCLGVVQLMSESLLPSDRARRCSPDRFVQNPLRNITVLFKNSRKLAMLSIAEVLQQAACCNSPDSGAGNIQTLALEQLRWSPGQLSYLRSFVSAGQLCHGWLLPFLTHRAPDGLRGAFRVCSGGLVASNLLVSQCWRAIGGKQRPTVFVVAQGLRASVGSATPVCLRALLVEAAMNDGIPTGVCVCVLCCVCARAGARVWVSLARSLTHSLALRVSLGEFNAALAGLRSMSSSLTSIGWAMALGRLGDGAEGAGTTCQVLHGWRRRSRTRWCSDLQVRLPR